MAGDNLKKVKAGDPFKFPASTFNSFVDAALDYQARNRSGGAGSAMPTAFDAQLIAIVKNDSGEDRAQFEVLGIDDVLFTPSDNLQEFKNHVVLTGVTPAAESSSEPGHRGKCVICAEPIKNGMVGRAYVGGCCPVYLDQIDDAHRFADFIDGDATQLQSVRIGSFQIVHAPASSEDLALVRFLHNAPQADVVVANQLRTRPGTYQGFVVTTQSNGSMTPKIFDTSAADAFTFGDIVDQDDNAEIVVIVNMDEVYQKGHHHIASVSYPLPFTRTGYFSEDGLPVVLVHASPVRGFMARVTQNPTFSAGWKRWVYSIVEVDSNWQAIDGGREGLCFNLTESINEETGLMGNGVDTDNLVGTFTIQPIPIDTIIWVQHASVTGTTPYLVDGNNSENVAYFTTYENAVDGDCPA